ncbi:hypothetical protein MMC16_001534 [Acarospora aff. strigata]|nr:hypothetical protein [Acarospora aff. strigata]
MSSTHKLRLTEAELKQALHILNYVLAQKGVQFGVIGGAACYLVRSQYGLPYRGTADIDIVVIPDPGNNIDADSLSRWLYEQNSVYFAKVDQYGVGIPAIRLMRDDQQLLIEVEIFDVKAWPNRPQYNLHDPDNDRTSINVNQAQVPILSPRWLLREKIMSQHQRQGSLKESTDIDDIQQLIRVVPEGALTLNQPEQVQALKALLVKCPELKDRLQSKIVCPEVFNATS